MHIKTNCPKCDADLHVTNFSVIIDEDEPDFAVLHIDCWRCTWDTQLKIEVYHSTKESE